MNRKNIIKFTRDWIIPIVISIILAFLINKFLIFKACIPSESMVPTINKHDRLFVSRIYNYDNIKRGDILVFYSNEFQQLFIKRVIGLPGDKVEIFKGIVEINGEIINEDYVKNNDFNYTGSFTVPYESYLFLGDNRSNSKDSRFWRNPYINKKDIKGKAWIRVYPYKNFGKIN